jgi:SRSO17 transposase
MDLARPTDGSAEFEKYVERLTDVIGHADRVRPLRDYCAGLLVSEGRKSIEPLAAVTAPAEVSAQHQRLMHFVANAPWSDEQVLAKVREGVLPVIERHGPIEVWIIDDTSFPKQGTHSVGVHHQYCGQLGKQANCQVAVTLSIANHYASLPIAYRLYLPQTWAEDPVRRKNAHVPKAVTFETKPQIALKQIRAAFKAGVPTGVVLMDASYGYNLALRSEITRLGLTYVAAITSTVKVCKAKARDPRRESVKELALRLPKHAWRTITWREGTNEALCSRFARVRMHASPTRGRRGRPEETLLIEWPRGEKEPTKYWLATVDEKIDFRQLVDLAKMRWRIERDYQDLKQEIGLGHYEGRGWPGFHHHGTLCIAAYGFLITAREAIPPSGPRCVWMLEKPAIPNCYRPRGASDQTATSHSQFDCHDPSLVGCRDRSNFAAMPVVHAQYPHAHETRGKMADFVTQ